MKKTLNLRNNSFSSRKLWEMLFSLAFVALICTACKFGSARLNSNGKLTQIAGARTLETTIDNYYGSISDGFQTQESISAKFIMKNEQEPGEQLLRFFVHLSPSNFSGNTFSPSDTIKISAIRKRGGVEQRFVTEQTLPFTGQNIAANAAFRLQLNDELFIIFTGVPKSAKEAGFSINTNVISEGDLTKYNHLEQGGTYSAIESKYRKNPSFTFEDKLTLPEGKSLYHVEATVHIEQADLGEFYISENASASLCTNQALAGIVELTLVNTPAAAPETISLPAEPLETGSCRLVFKGSLIAGSDSGGAPEISYKAQIAGVIPNQQIVSTSVLVSKETGATHNLDPIGPRPNIGRVGKPNYSFDNWYGGKIATAGQKVTYQFPIANSDAGLILRPQAYLFYPINDGGKSLASAFLGTEGEPNITATLKNKSGAPLADQSGTAVAPFGIVSSGHGGVRWESLTLQSPPQDGVLLEFEMPPSILPGAVVSFMVEAEVAKSLIDPLPSDTVNSFKAQQGRAKASVHSWDKPAYEKDAKPLREPVPLADVLQAMEEIRDVQHLAVNNVNPFTGTKVELSSKNIVDDATITACLGGNAAPHWSDLTMHYYCLFDYLRLCYTNGIRDTATAMLSEKQNLENEISDPKEIEKGMLCRVPSVPRSALGLERRLPVITLHKAFPPSVTLRQYVFEMCQKPESESLANTTPNQNIIPGMCRDAAPVFSYAPSSDDRKSFAALKTMSQKKYAPVGLQEKVFRYLLEAPSFAFNDEQQQQVINAFWRVKDPSDPDECAKRPARQIDPQDGTHCLPNALGTDQKPINEKRPGFKLQNPLQEPADR